MGILRYVVADPSEGFQMIEGVMYIVLPAAVIVVIFIVTEAIFSVFNVIMRWFRG